MIFAISTAASKEHPPHNRGDDREPYDETENTTATGVNASLNRAYGIHVAARALVAFAGGLATKAKSPIIQPTLVDVCRR